MERQKQVKTSAVIKMETFLNRVYLRIGRGDSFSLDAEARSNQMSGSIATILKRCNVVGKIRGSKKELFWTWLYPTKPDRALAVTMMDEILRNNKKTMLAKSLEQSDHEPNLFGKPITEKEISDILKLSFRFEDMDLFPWQLDSFNEKITFASQELINKFYKP